MKNKKFLVVGNPIDHSLSPTLHNFWFKKYKLKNCLYKKQKLNAFDLAKFVKNIRSGKIYGANVTVPFKNKIIKTEQEFLLKSRFELKLLSIE